LGVSPGDRTKKMASVVFRSLFVLPSPLTFLSLLTLERKSIRIATRIE